MKQRISRVSVHQTSLVVAVVYAILGLIVGPLIWLVSLVDAPTMLPFWTVLVFPILYAVLGYVATAVMLVIYNTIASFTGGVEVTLTPSPDSTPIG